MFEDPAFTRAVKARWAELRPVVDAMIAEIPVAADVIRPSALNNWAIWPQTTESELWAACTPTASTARSPSSAAGSPPEPCG